MFNRSRALIVTLLLACTALPVAADLGATQQIAQLSAQTKRLEQSLAVMKQQLKELQTKQSSAKAAPSAQPQSIYEAKPGQAQGPATRAYFQAPDLLATISSTNEDLSLLRHRQKVAHSMGKGYQSSPTVVVSGELDAQLTDKRSFSGHRDSRVDLSGTTLDFFGTATPWALGYASIEYDNSMGSGNNNRVLQNSNVFLATAFVTMGELDHSPVYATMGQFSLPFGRYSTYMINKPVTKRLGRIKQRALQFGYARSGWNAQAYAYKGETNIGRSGIDEFGANVTAASSHGAWNWHYGAGLTSNLAESKQMQSNGGSGFAGFAVTGTTESLAHRVPALDVHTEINRGNKGLNLEYVAAVRRFAVGNLDYNGQGAKPSAFYAEAICHHHIGKHPLAAALGYGHTSQSLAVHLPRYSVAASLSSFWWQDTLFALEYRYDRNYALTDTAAGAGSSNFSPTKRNEHSLTAQVSLFF